MPTYGCWTPTDFAALQAGERVLDLDSGASLDCFWAWEAVGDNGWVLGDELPPEEFVIAAGAVAEEVRAR